ncbi:MAG: hypothetical protein U1G08_17250 [Verrucomicrobiota bacterium]
MIRSAQAPADAVVANNAIRALKQINGTLTDASGVLIPNEAAPGSEAGGAYAVDTVNFEKDGAEVDIIDLESNPLATFYPLSFPGIPGSGGGTDKFAVEAIGFLELAAGQYTFGVSTTTERTDINDDDAYQVFVARNPHDYFGLKLADYERIAPGFQTGWRNENQFTVVAPVNGLYPFRILYWQTGNGASLNFYTIDTATGTRVLVNDPADVTAVKAYRDSSVPDANAPYVADASPSAGSEGNSASAPIDALIVDGATTVSVGDVKLFLNDAPVTPQTLTKADGKITLSYNPNATRTNPNNLVRLEYKDSLAVNRTSTWSFGIKVSGGSSTQVAGQWDFDSGDLSATVGKPLQYLDPSYDGPSGSAEDKTAFGTTADFGIPNIGSKPDRVLRVPGTLSRQIGYVVDHGIKPNGGGTRVNQYTLIMDVFVATSGAGAASLWQTSSVNNTDDGDLFWQGNNFGQGGGGYNGRGTFTTGAWHRIVAAYDMAASTPVVAKFVDGIKQDDWTANQGLDAARRSLGPTAILFGDGDQDERREMWVNSVQIRNGRISDAEAFLLGGPSEGGIPQQLAQSTVTGQWDFEFGDLGASIGSNLQYLDPTYDGPNGTAEDKTTFGTTTDLGIAGPGGVEAKVMRVPGTLTRQLGYVVDHRIAPNGGGTRVNQYTLIMDVFVADTGAGAASLWQTSSPNNTDDGDLFWQGSNFGQGGGGYNGRGTFTTGAWHRIVAAYDMAAKTPLVAKFVDGIKQDDWTANQGLDAARRSLGPTAILFGDGDQDERREMFVSAVQIRAGRISDAQAVLLGGPSASGIPVALPESNVTGQWDFEFGDLGATIGANLKYLDPTFDGPTGTSENKTGFGATTDLGVADINGQPAKVLRVPGDLDRRLGYILDPRISPNGGGTRVNQYTLIMDVLVAETGAGAASLWQTSSANNTDDGDLFWQGNNFGQGGGGYNGTGAFTTGSWHRIAAAYDMAATPPVVRKYVDGIFQDNWTNNQGLDNPRRTIADTAILFGDGDQDERREMWVNSVQIRSGALSAAELESLGAPTSGGIPIVLANVVVPPAVSVGADSAGNVIITFTGTLEASPGLGQAFVPVSGATSPYTINKGDLKSLQLYRSSN